MARVVGIHLRPASGSATVAVEQATALAGRGLAGDHASGGSRQITLLALEDWTRACGELGQPLDPAGRRANLVVEGLTLADTLGRRLRIGQILVEVVGWTLPCGNMDRFHAGLRRALQPAGRGGVHGRILRGGEVARGDPVHLLSPEEE